MGNAALQRRCREKAGGGGTEGTKRSESAADVEAPAAPRRAAVVVMRWEQRWRNEELQEEEAVMTTTRAGGDGDDGATPAPTSVVKLVMRRKDAEALVARLHAQKARERKARMAELKRLLRAGRVDDGRSAPSCRDAWRPRLASVQENQC